MCLNGMDEYMVERIGWKKRGKYDMGGIPLSKIKITDSCETPWHAFWSSQ